MLFLFEMFLHYICRNPADVRENSWRNGESDDEDEDIVKPINTNLPGEHHICLKSNCHHATLRRFRDVPKVVRKDMSVKWYRIAADGGCGWKNQDGKSWIGKCRWKKIIKKKN